MRLIFGAVAILWMAGATTNSAVAADPRFNWSGCYAGFQGGMVWGLSNQTYGGTRAGALDPFLPVGFDVTGDYRMNGIQAGVTTGCNYQFNNRVLGLEIDASLLDGVGEAAPTPATVLAGANPSRRFTTEQDWLTTARVRAGFANDKWFGFITGGIALAGFEVNNHACLVAANACRIATKKERVGWVVGLGFEHLINERWSVKSDLLYVDFGKFYYSDSPAANGCVQCYSMNVETTEVILRFGLNYRFNSK